MPRMRLTTIAVASMLAFNTRAVAQTPATWTLTETLRIGGGDAGPTSFNYIKSIAVGGSASG